MDPDITFLGTDKRTTSARPRRAAAAGNRAGCRRSRGRWDAVRQIPGPTPLCTPDRCSWRRRRAGPTLRPSDSSGLLAWMCRTNSRAATRRTAAGRLSSASRMARSNSVCASWPGKRPMISIAAICPSGLSFLARKAAKIVSAVTRTSRPGSSPFAARARWRTAFSAYSFNSDSASGGFTRRFEPGLQSRWQIFHVDHVGRG